MQANLNMIEDNFCRESVMLLRQFDDPLRKNNDRDVIKDDTLSYPIIPKHRKLMVLFTRNLMCVCVCACYDCKSPAVRACDCLRVEFPCFFGGS